jgi:ubiquinone/menaquinone biosynthesis C-methylase UbiE
VIDAKDLDTSEIDSDVAFNAVFKASEAYRAFFNSDEQLRPNLRILSAGCGTGIDTLALIRVLQNRGFGYQEIDAFDLTPSMLERFQQAIDAERIPNVHPAEANVLKPQSLPNAWTNTI